MGPRPRADRRLTGLRAVWRLRKTPALAVSLLRLASAAAVGDHRSMTEPMDPERRRRLLDLLEDRARLLRPSAQLIDKAIDRCREVQQRVPGTSTRISRQTQTLTAKVGTPRESRSTGRSPLPQPPRPVNPEATELDSRPPPPPVGEHRQHLPPGTLVAGYRIEEPLGSGGMGVVYRAVQLSMNRTVALKVLAPKFVTRGRVRERFLREARAAGRLHHPNLIAVHDVGEADGRMFFSMELVQGRTLKQEVAARGPLPVDETLDFARQILVALRYAHDRGVIHRDIKPDNLMLDRRSIEGEDARYGRIKIADLGLSRLDPERTGATGTELFTTQVGASLGTPHYMAPEQGQDAHGADHRADLYGVGATLYHLVCGRPPFDGPTPTAIMVAAATTPLTFPPPSDGRPPVPEPVQTLIRRLMAVKPEDRPEDANTALKLVLQISRGEVPVRLAPSPSQRLRSQRVGRRWGCLGLSILGLGVVAAAVLAGPMLLAELAWRDERGRIGALTEVGDLAGAHAAALLAEERAERALRVATDQPWNALVGAIAAADARLTDARSVRVATAAAWDRQAQAAARSHLEASDDAFAAQKLSAALAALDAIPAALLSPAVTQEVLHHREAIAAAIDSAKADSQSTGEVLEALRRQSAKNAEHQAELWWGVAVVQPPGSLSLNGSVAEFTGTGTATRPVPLSLDRPRLAQRKVVLNLDSSIASGFWEIRFGGGRSLRVTTDGPLLILPGGEQKLPPTAVVPPEGRSPPIQIQWRGESMAVALRGGDAVVLPGATPNRLEFAWEIPPPARAQVRIGLDFGGRPAAKR